MKQQGDILLNPIRMRIIQLMAGKRVMTVAQITEFMNDVPRTTLYRHMNVLLEHGYVTISREVRVRGTYEREYTLNLEVLQSTSPENIETNTNTFLLKLIADFSHYFKGGKDPMKDRLFLSSNGLVLSDDEFEKFLDEMFAVVKKYMNFPADNERKERIISIISSPSKKEDCDVE